MDEVNLLETTDAAVWAKEFMRITGGTADEGTMIAWFANMWAATHDPLAAQLEQAYSFIAACTKRRVHMGQAYERYEANLTIDDPRNEVYGHAKAYRAQRDKGKSDAEN